VLGHRLRLQAKERYGGTGTFAVVQSLLRKVPVPA
jgi:hypothetical protein